MTARATARDLVARLPGRRRQRRRLPWVAAGLVLVVTVLVATWWMHRLGAEPDAPGPDVADDAFDRAALDRATDEGMRSVTPARIALPRSNGWAGALSGVGQLLQLLL